MTERERNWLAGILEGDGTFCTQKGEKESHARRPVVSFHTSDEDVGQRVASLLSTKLYGPYKRQGSLGIKPMYQVAIYWQRARDLMNDIYPLMGHRRQQQIGAALEKEGAS